MLTSDRFTHFENMSDVQMLAMMSCVLSEPAAEAGVKTAVLQLNQKVKFSSKEKRS